ncbi:unnamed protein product [Auanema sp. JU1783]|nr:unnamed protein product [Auanema sp. JU1783]
MGKVFKKKQSVDAAVEAKRALKRKADEEHKQEEEAEEEISEQSVDSEEVVDQHDIEDEDEDFDDEELEDEDNDDEEEDDDDDDDDDDNEGEENEEEDDDDDDGDEERKEFSDFDIEAFPLEEKDKEGLIDMLTQIFLRTNIDCNSIVDEMIRISPFGNVLGPAEEETVEDTANLVFSVVTCLDLDFRKVPADFAKSIYEFVMDKANLKAVTEVRTALTELGKERFGFLINERLLDFPTQAVRQCFDSLKIDLAGMQKPFDKVLYIHKIRYVDGEKGKVPSVPAAKKKKLGKAAKKRLAADVLASSRLVFDCPEDEDLYNLKEGSVTFFDYPVFGDVETGSKFHIIEKDGEKLKPFRRAVIMDKKRFNAFINHVAKTSY